MKISPHFSLDEMIKSQTALRKGLDNNPDAEQLEALVDLCEYVLEPIRKHWSRPVIVSSAFRAPAVNKAIGSKNTSQHTKGQAADIEIPGIDNLALYYWVAKNADYDQLILEYYTGEPASGWVHVSYAGVGNRHQTLRIDKGGVSRETIPHSKAA
jgi:zinc D-Ala-D-Ala carboxypeptidase|tara:strand:+ start:1659 stop:2123 length:465 start_codon:yes stop_codon:yes gene_type:complete